MKGLKFLSVAVASAMCLAFGACSSEDDILKNGGEDIVNNQVSTLPAKVYSVTLVNANGNEVTNFNSAYGTYFVKVEAQGKWNLYCNEDFITIRQKSGTGNALIPFYINNNWYDSRTFNIYATAVTDQDTRADDAPGANGTQEPSSNSLDKIKARITSNLGTGYTIMPRTDGNLALSTGIQLFNMQILEDMDKDASNKITYLKDDYYDMITQYVLTSNSNSDLHKGVTVGAEATIKKGGLSGGGEVGVGVGKEEKTGKMYAVKRMLREMYSREINYSNIIAAEQQNPELNLISPGFRMIRDNFTEQIKAALKENNTDKADKLCAQFIDENGCSFISKSLIGCSFDYYIAVDSTFLDDSVTVHVVLNAKYNKIVTDTTKVDDTTTTKKDTTNAGGKVNVDYENRLKKAENSTEAQVIIYGGNTNTVDILATGGSLDLSEVTKWRGSVTPDNVVMVDLRSTPITALFTDPEAKDYLHQYIVKNASTTSIKDETTEEDKK